MPAAIDILHAIDRVQRSFLVDDETILLRAISRTIERAGHRVLTATDGVQTLEVFALWHASIDVVVLDLTMPRMNGIETLAEIRKHDPVLPVVIASGYRDERLDGGRLDTTLTNDPHTLFLSKPYNFRGLRAVVHELMG